MNSQPPRRILQNLKRLVVQGYFAGLICSAHPPTEQAMEVAVQCHQSGRLADAEKAYRQVLASGRARAQLHLLGVVAHQFGRNDEAAELIRRSIAINPNFAEAHGNLGVVLKNQGKFAEAIESCRTALQLNPDNPEVHNNLGNALAGQGSFDEAIVAFRRAIQLRPDYAAAYCPATASARLSGNRKSLKRRCAKLRRSR